MMCHAFANEMRPYFYAPAPVAETCGVFFFPSLVSFFPFVRRVLCSCGCVSVGVVWAPVFR